ncbi:MAG: hypothetical protein OXJ64_13235 [Boseongicola sp.]|nr:hypothetical protein [Boseongicola sp.]
MGRDLGEQAGGKAWVRIFAVAGMLFAVTLAACSIGGKGKDVASRRFLECIEREIIYDDPLSRLGEVSEAVRACHGGLGSGDTLAGLVERNFRLAAEFRRHRESDGPMTQDAYEINRYYLDPDDTDHKRVFERFYRFNPLTLTSFTLYVNVFTRPGEVRETVTAFLQYNHL